MMSHYLLALDWWPNLQQQDCHFMLGTLRVTLGERRAGCEVEQRLALGGLAAFHYLNETEAPSQGPTESRLATGYREGLPGKLRRSIDWNKGRILDTFLVGGPFATAYAGVRNGAEI